jgi:hypothetical protein
VPVVDPVSSGEVSTVFEKRLASGGEKFRDLEMGRILYFEGTVIPVVFGVDMQMSCRPRTVSPSLERNHGRRDIL